MAKTPFKLKSGNSAPFKQMGSFPMTRSQARTLSQKHMKDGAYTTMPGESRFQMHQRLRRAGTMGDTVVEGETVRGTETYLGKHLEAKKMKREGEGYEGKKAQKGRREEFVKGVKEFGKRLMSIPDKIREKVESDDETVTTEESTDQTDTNQVDANQVDANQVDAGDLYYYTFSGKKGDKFKYRHRGDKSFGEGAYEFQRPGSDVWETSKTQAQSQAIHDLFIGDYEGQNVEITPIE